MSGMDPRGSPFFRTLHTLNVEEPGARAWAAPRLLPTLPIEHGLNPPPRPIRFPPRQVRKEVAARREIFGNCPPLTASTQNVKYAVKLFSSNDTPLTPSSSARWNQQL